MTRRISINRQKEITRIPQKPVEGIKRYTNVIILDSPAHMKYTYYTC